jgi:hypothetical protein
MVVGTLTVVVFLSPETVVVTLSVAVTLSVTVTVLMSVGDWFWMIRSPMQTWMLLCALQQTMVVSQIELCPIAEQLASPPCKASLLQQ